MPHRDASLFVVATPIGNLQDITLRALEVLAEVDLVVSENVRKTRNLLDHFGITTRVASYREENARRMGRVIVATLSSGKNVALVAEAGTPGVSDPGRLLVGTVRSEGFKVIPVPGPSALAAALSVAGMDEQRFAFEGFLPRRGSKRRQRLGDLAEDPRAIVVFEAPHRLVECLSDMLEILGDRPMVVCRELTKVYEEIDSGPVSHFVARYRAAQPVGEFVIICGGAPAAGGGQAAAGSVSFERALAEARELVAGGRRKTEAAKMIERKYRLRRGELYQALTTAGPKAPAKGEVS
jgi:16S rRNA (cytidine1402-2'-O)-methyltransferase